MRFSYAAVENHLEMLELLVKGGADVNEVSKDSPWAGPLARTVMGFNPLDKKARLKTLSEITRIRCKSECFACAGYDCYDVCCKAWYELWLESCGRQL